MTTTQKIGLTIKEMEDVFTEWTRQSRENGPDFMDSETVKENSPRKLGKLLTESFMRFLLTMREQKKRKAKRKGNQIA